MWEWIAGNQQTISALASIGMLVVWLAYLQLFLNGYRRQRRPKILITRGAGSGLGARCLVSNMSAEAIYLASIMATLETSDGRWACPITDIEGAEERETLSDRKLPTRQGPLLAGHVVDVGTFHSLVAHVLKHVAGESDDVEPFIRTKLMSIEIIVIAVYGSEDLLTGAKRLFEVVRGGGGDELKLRSPSADTIQMRSRRERRKLGAVLRTDL